MGKRIDHFFEGPKFQVVKSSLIPAATQISSAGVPSSSSSIRFAIFQSYSCHSEDVEKAPMVEEEEEVVKVNEDVDEGAINDLACGPDAYHRNLLPLLEDIKIVACLMKCL